MTDPAAPDRPVPRWLHAWAVLTVCFTPVLLVLGQLVTTFGAGMADPVWPTEPWYLFVIGWQEPNRGFLIEHAHRIAGWTIGGLVGVLALGMWWTDPRTPTRWYGLLAVLVLTAGYGQFHGAFRAQKDAVELTVPWASIGVMAVGLAAAVGIGVAGFARGVRGSGLRLLALAALVAVMVQGLLGGFRVRLNALVGTDLAAVHGVFAQVVFCVLVSLAVLTARPAALAVSPATLRALKKATHALVGLLFLQLVWGAMVRHAPTPFAQRMHLLTAFLIVVAAVVTLRHALAPQVARRLAFAAGWAIALLAVFGGELGLLITAGWLAAVVVGTPLARQPVARLGFVLGALVALQVALGVEAWLGKFTQYTLPELVPLTKARATVRTAHVLVGTGVLATAVALAIRVRVRAAGDGGGGSGEDRAAVVTTTVPAFALSGRGQPGETP